MRKYEYKRIGSATVQLTNEELNLLGAAGWQCVTLTPDWCSGLFMRELPPDPRLGRVFVVDAQGLCLSSYRRGSKGNKKWTFGHLEDVMEGYSFNSIIEAKEAMRGYGEAVELRQLTSAGLHVALLLPVKTS